MKRKSEEVTVVRLADGYEIYPTLSSAEYNHMVRLWGTEKGNACKAKVDKCLAKFLLYESIQDGEPEENQDDKSILVVLLVPKE